MILASAVDMGTKLNSLVPEILLTLTAFAVMILGLSQNASTRRFTYVLSMGSLAIAAILAIGAPGETTALAQFFKVATCLIGMALFAVAADLPDEASSQPIDRDGQKFDPSITTRGEFFGFFLLSLVGAMLCAGADDLIWLFLALELTSLPTYVLVSVSRRNIRAQEAGVKYFFLGAFAAAVFLYGFALIYTATGSTYLYEIQASIQQHGLSPMGLLGMLLAVIGVSFKIAAFPMHFYAADVYEGAATPVSTFLAYVPKAAGIVTLMLLLQAAGWADGGNHAILSLVLWTSAVMTMLIGNTLALLQNNVKRVLAYSSIAHSGYMLVGLIAGPGGEGQAVFVRDGLAASLFYLVAYGVMNLGAFAVLGLLKRGGEEAETFDDLRGLFRRHPAMAIVMAVCVLSLTGIPPLVGFWGKLYLVSAAFGAGYHWLGVFMVLNSAIAAYYYLRIFGVCFLQEPLPATRMEALPSRGLAAGLAAVVVIILSLFSTGFLLQASSEAAHTHPGIEAHSPDAHGHVSEPTDKGGH